MSKPTVENTALGQGPFAAGDAAEADALRQSETRYRSLVLATAATVWTTDSSGGFNSPQGSWQAYTGQSWERHRGWGWREMLHPEDRDRMAAAWRATLERRGMFYVEGRVWNANCGEYRFCEVRGVPILHDDGTVREWVGTTTDVHQHCLTHTEQLRQWNVDLEKRVSERTAELESKNSELEAFAHSVSHDLRAPLRGMERFAVALQEDYENRLDEKGRQFVQHIVDSARRMDVLINDLLAYSGLSRDQLALKPVSLRKIVKSSLNQLENEIRAHDAEVVVPSELPKVVGHAATTGQIVANLVSNAVKFVAPGDRPRVRLSVETRGNMARLWVEDNGIGIAPQHHQTIFHVFERLHGIETFPGTGIGLAIVSRATERMAGRCGVESTPGIGSRFWVELPLHSGGRDG